MIKRGFILTPTYRVVAGRPEVHLHSVLEDGGPALIVDDRLTPYFFVRTADAPLIGTVTPGLRLLATELRDFAGAPVSRVETGLPQDVPPLQQRDLPPRPRQIGRGHQPVMPSADDDDVDGIRRAHGLLRFHSGS